MNNETNAVRTFIRSVPLGKDSGKQFAVPLHELLPPTVVAAALDAADPKARLLRDLLLVGTSRIFVDCQASAKTDAERLGACDKKLDAWREGEMNVKGGGGGGETVEGEVKRLLIAAYMAASGATETKALKAMPGKGFEVLRAIADRKAAAMAIEPTFDADVPEATRAELIAAHANAVKAEADRLYEIAKADWTARAEASLQAKAAARSKTGTMDVADLI